MRVYEIIPGMAAWVTLLGLTFLSWKLPQVVVIFILLYDLYWLLKLFYLFLHLRFALTRMRKNLKIDWLEKLKAEKLDWERIRHLVILPMYKEPYGVVDQSLESLVEANYPKEKMLILLACEERGGEADRETAQKIEKKFGSVFGGFATTFHPADLPGELPGKGSNETWAIKHALPDLVDAHRIPYEDVLVSVFDSDTRTEKDYFGILAHHFLKASNPLRSSYQPIPLFTNNLGEAKFFARLVGFSSSFWHLMQSSRPEQLVTFSSHSLPLKALVDVGFWETNLVSEDARIFFQCLARYKGDWRTVPLLYPVYMDAVVGKNFFEAMKNLYKQQRRWAWGAENFVYLARDLKKEKGIPKRVRRFWLWTEFDGFFSWSTSSFIIFLFGILPNILGNENFKSSILSYNLPRMTGVILNLSTIGIIVSAVLSILLMAPRIKGFKKRYYFYYFVEWALMPLVFIFFGAIPALDAQTRLMIGGKARLGYWRTPKAAGQSS